MHAALADLRLNIFRIKTHANRDARQMDAKKRFKRAGNDVLAVQIFKSEGERRSKLPGGNAEVRSDEVRVLNEKIDKLTELVQRLSNSSGRS